MILFRSRFRHFSSERLGTVLCEARGASAARDLVFEFAFEAGFDFNSKILRLTQEKPIKGVFIIILKNTNYLFGKRSGPTYNLICLDRSTVLEI